MAELDWHSYVPVVAADHTRGYFDIPVFEVSGIVWEGASKIVQQFNLSATKNFALRGRPVKPAGANFVPCIRYRIGNDVFRYKLWDDAALVLHGVALYSGQIIKKHAVIEIWNLNGQATASMTSAMRLQTGIRRTVTDFSAIPADYSDATPADAGDLRNDNVMDAREIVGAGLVAQWKSDVGLTLVGSAVSEWLDQVSGQNLATVSGVPQFSDVDLINGYPIVTLDNGQLEVANPFAAANLCVLFAVIRQNAWVATEPLFATVNGAGSASLAQGYESPKLVPDMQATPAADGHAGARIGQWSIVKWDKNRTTNIGSVEVDKVGAISTPAVGGTLAGGTFRVGYANVSVAEILLYNAAFWGGFVQQRVAEVYDYLISKYGLGMGMDLTLPDGSPYLSN